MNEPKEKPRRGRPPTYDTAQALARATDVFWRSGYSASTLDALSAATGLHRPSLQGAFGDKRDLYLTTLRRYVAEGRREMIDALNGDRPLRDALRRVYDRALAMYLPAREPARGCFLIGTAATEAVTDADVRAVLAAGLRDFDGLFEERLRRAQTRGELAATADPATLAKLASAVLHSLAVRSRAGDPRASLRALAEAGVELLCAERSGGVKARARRSRRRHG